MVGHGSQNVTLLRTLQTTLRLSFEQLQPELISSKISISLFLINFLESIPIADHLSNQFAFDYHSVNAATCRLVCNSFTGPGDFADFPISKRLH